MADYYLSKTAAQIDALLEKVEGVEAGANKTIVDSTITETGSNPVNGGAIYNALSLKQDTIDHITQNDIDNLFT